MNMPMHNKPSLTRPKRNGNLCIRQCCMQSKAAMSLVEISIVIVILGLLTTAIIGGASIRKMAGQKNMVNGINAMTQSLILFKQTYGYWPGDFPNANEVFGPMSNISAKCPMIDNDGNAGGTTTGVAGNGDGIISKKEAGTPVKEWGSEAMFMACHMVLSGLTPSGMSGLGMRSNQHVHIDRITSPTHSTFGGRSLLHLPTYSKSFLTYGATDSGLPAVQINSSQNVFKDIVPLLLQAQEKKSLDVHTQDILTPYHNTETKVATMDLSTVPDDASQVIDSAHCITSEMKYWDALWTCASPPSNDANFVYCTPAWQVPASSCSILTGSSFVTYANRCECNFGGLHYLMPEKYEKFAVHTLYVPVSE